MTSRPQSKDRKSKKKPSLGSTPREDILAKVIKKNTKPTIEHNIYSKISSTIYCKSKSNKLETNHSRKLSGRKESIDKPILIPTNKRHAKSNSACIRPQHIKHTFKIDLSSFMPQQKPIQLVSQQTKPYSRNSFVFRFILGKGGFGRVWSVQLKKTGKKYAMKEMLKTKIMNKNSIKSILQQLRLLTQLRHPFLVNIFCAFHQRDYLYLVMDHLTGGDLRYHISRKNRFKQSEVKFFLGCCILGVEYLHKNNVIHRDIKPENLILDKRGYLRITDLGVAKMARPNNKFDTSGTPGYMAPEVMIKQDHTFAVDFYAIGVIAYEFMLGRRPYEGENRQEILNNIRAKQVQVLSTQIPKGWSANSLDFINRLIQRKADQRLGFNGVQQLKNHPWFQGFQWQKLLKKQIQPTYIPKSVASSVDYRAQISSLTDQNIDQEGRLLLKYKQEETNIDLFEDYQYFPMPVIQAKQVKEKGSKQKSRKVSKKHSTGSTTAGTFNPGQEDVGNKKNSKKTIFFQ